MFVTNAGVNPTSTIAALALRAAEHLVEQRSEVPRPEPTTTFAVDCEQTVTVPEPAAESAPAVITFGVEERGRLAALADALLPPRQDRPAPSAVGIAKGLLEQVLAARPDLAEPLRRALVGGAAGTGADARLQELADDDAEACDALELVVAGGYYMSPDVRAAIGYLGQVPRPVVIEGLPA